MTKNIPFGPKILDCKNENVIIKDLVLKKQYIISVRRGFFATILNVNVAWLKKLYALKVKYD